MRGHAKFAKPAFLPKPMQSRRTPSVGRLLTDAYLGMNRAMTTACLPLRMPLLAALVACVAITLSGCHPIDLYDQSLNGQVPPGMEPPRELSMVSLPQYRIEPPDMIQIEMLRLIPLPPHRLEVYDVLRIQASGVIPEIPIGPVDDQGNPTPSQGLYVVDADGNVTLGPVYGTVRVVGLTVEEAEQVIVEHLRVQFREPAASVQLARVAAFQDITGQYIVAPDGTVNLRRYGLVHVAGKTAAEAKAALEENLRQYFDSPELGVDVGEFRSKRYYVITQGASLGDNVAAIPITGSETVLDAIAQVGGLSQLSSTNMWIARPAPDGFGHDQILPVDWDAIAKNAATDTNYQIMPDDRVYIAEDGTLALTNYLSRTLAPIQQIAGVTSLGSSTARAVQTMGRAFNELRRQ